MTRGPEEAAAELRELIREANGAVKDLRQVLREVREAAAAAAGQAAAAAAAAGSRELDRYSRHLQESMNQQTAELKTAVDQARERITGMLLISELKMEHDPDGRPVLKLKWADGDFDPHVPLPDGPPMADTVT